MHLKYRSLLGAAVLASAVVSSQAQRPPSPAPSPAVPPAGANAETLTALQQLANSNAQLRADAAAKLQQAMVHEMQETVATQQLVLKLQHDMGTELRLLTNSTDAALDAQVSTAGLLEFQIGVDRWAIDVLALPAERRDAILKWGLTDNVLPLMARIYGPNVESRMQSLRELAALPLGPETNWVVGRMMNDADRQVALTALDILYTRPPDPALIDALWTRATAATMAQIRQRNGRVHIVTVGGREIQFADDSLNRPQDADIATDLLIKYKDPTIVTKLDALFSDFAASIVTTNDYRWRTLLPNYGDSGGALSRLIDAYKPRQAVVLLAHLLDMDSREGNDINVNVNGQPQKYHMSPRIDLAAMLIRITGQNVDDYGIQKLPNYGNNRMGIKGTASDEEEMVKKLQNWWKDHAKDYGGAAGLP